jgi:hypothetical protein
MALSLPTAAEIDRKLRDDFARRLQDFGIAPEASDPILAVLFRTFAKQLETLYNETENIRLALLDELINGLGIQNRSARAAQTIVRFGVDRHPEYVPAGTALAGNTEAGEKLIFTTDAGVMVSRARIALAATYQKGSLRLMGGVEMPDEVRAARPSLEPVPASLGACPAIFIAIEDVPPSHLSRHSLFIDISSEARAIAEALRSESWCLAVPDGVFEGCGVLRPRPANVGVRLLEWLIPESGEAAAAEARRELPTLPGGFYSGRCFVFPEIGPGGRFLCRCPRAMEPAFSRMFGAPQNLLSKERAWLRIGLPQAIGDLHTGLHSLTLHASSASNVEGFNQTVYFDKHGTSIPVSGAAGTGGYLLSPLSISGECGSNYLPEFQPSSDHRDGRYSIRNGRIVLTPARGPDGKPDAYANLRLWLTSGARGNQMGAGGVQAFAGPVAAGLRMSNLTAAVGGANEESFTDARSRFAEAVLSRDRLVTRSDFLTALRAFDRRVLGASLSADLERGIAGLRRVQRIRVQLDREAVLDPAAEGPVLAREIESYLADRFFYDMELHVDLEWK